MRVTDRDGEPVSPGDVLDDQEQAEYAASQRSRSRPWRVPRAATERWDELGYSSVTGRWDPYKEQG